MIDLTFSPSLTNDVWMIDTLCDVIRAYFDNAAGERQIKERIDKAGGK